MLTGQALGKAIRAAIKLRWGSYAEAARFFGVKPESVQGWMKSGAISKPNFAKLKKEAAAFVPQNHWGDGGEVPYSLNAIEVQLIDIYRALPDKFRDALLQDANKYLGLANPEPSAANPFPPSRGG